MLWIRIASFYAEFDGMFGNFLQQIIKICIQLQWIYQMKRESENKQKDTTELRFFLLLYNSISFWKSYGMYSYLLLSLIKLLHKYINYYNEYYLPPPQTRPKYCCSIVPYVCICFRKRLWNLILSFAQLNRNIIIIIINITSPSPDAPIVLNKQKYQGALLPVLYVCISFRKSYGINSYLLLAY